MNDVTAENQRCNSCARKSGCVRNIGSEESARHNEFMFSVIKSCRMCWRSVERYLTGLLEKLKTAKDGDDLTCSLPCFMPA